MAIKAAEREGKRHSLSLRVTAEVRKGLETAASVSGRSMTQEAEFRLEQSFDEDLLRGPGGRMLYAMRKVTTKILRMAKKYQGDGKPTLQNEINTRRELRAAIEVIAHVYAATEERRPIDPYNEHRSPQENIDLIRPWGSGDAGRGEAYRWLEWDDGDATPLDRAKTTAIDALWTGANEELGDLRLAEDDDENAKEVEWRMFQCVKPAPLFMPRDAIPKSEEPRPSDSGPDEGDEPDTDAPAEKPKRTRRSKPKA